MADLDAIRALKRAMVEDLERQTGPTVFVASYCCPDYYCGCGPDHPDAPTIGSHLLGVFGSEDAAKTAIERAGVGRISGWWVTPLDLNVVLPSRADR